MAITREFLELRKRDLFYVFIKSQKSMKCLRYVNKLKIVTRLLCYSLYVKCENVHKKIGFYCPTIH